MRNYTIVDDEWIRLIGGPYDGIMYKYGKVNLIEEDDLLRIQFEYQLDDGSQMDNDFVQYIGPILSELIESQLINNSIVYTGGK